MYNEFHISTNKDLLDLDFIHDYMTNVSYWGKGRTLEQTKGTIENSFCFGMFTNTMRQVGFARVVTDDVFFGNIMDVIIDPEFQGRGLGKFFMEYMLNHDKIKKLQTVTLKTKDAHAFYEQHGFQKVGDSPLYMSKDKQKLE